MNIDMVNKALMLMAGFKPTTSGDFISESADKIISGDDAARHSASTQFLLTFLRPLVDRVKLEAASNRAWTATLSIGNLTAQKQSEDSPLEALQGAALSLGLQMGMDRIKPVKVDKAASSEEE